MVVWHHVATPCDSIGEGMIYYYSAVAVVSGRSFPLPEPPVTWFIDIYVLEASRLDGDQGCIIFVSMHQGAECACVPLRR